jgi:hypothetical protein
MPQCPAPAPLAQRLQLRRWRLRRSGALALAGPAAARAAARARLVRPARRRRRLAGQRARLVAAQRSVGTILARGARLADPLAQPKHVRRSQRRRDVVARHRVGIVVWRPQQRHPPDSAAPTPSRSPGTPSSARSAVSSAYPPLSRPYRYPPPRDPNPAGCRTRSPTTIAYAAGQRHRIPNSLADHRRRRRQHLRLDPRLARPLEHIRRAVPPSTAYAPTSTESPAIATAVPKKSPASRSLAASFAVLRPRLAGPREHVRHPAPESLPGAPTTAVSPSIATAKPNRSDPPRCRRQQPVICHPARIRTRGPCRSPCRPIAGSVTGVTRSAPSPRDRDRAPSVVQRRHRIRDHPSSTQAPSAS